MIITQSTKNAWLRTTITTEDAKNFRIKELQSMRYTVTAVLGLTKVLCSTRVYSTRNLDQIHFVEPRSLIEEKVQDLML